VGNIEAVPTLNRLVFTEASTRSLYLLDPNDLPEAPTRLSAAVNVIPTAFAVHAKTGFALTRLLIYFFVVARWCSV